MASSYNPFYIPSLKTLQKQAAAEAQAQVNAALAALPSEAGVNSDFASRGRSLQGFDTAYINFLKAQNTANAAQSAPPNLSPPSVTSGGQQTPGTAAEAKAAADASAMLGIGYKNQGIALQNAAAANLATNQATNRKALFDAITALHTQQGAERAKLVPLTQDILKQKKADAFQAYQAYLSNQLAAAQLGATSSFNQGKLDISQQNADTAAQNAATRANDSANKNSGGVKSKDKSAAYKYIDKLIAHTDQVNNPVTMVTWSANILSGNPPTPHQVTVGEFPAGTSQDVILAAAKKQYPTFPNLTIAQTGTRTDNRTESKHYSYDYIYNAAWHQLKSIGYSQATAKRLAKNYLHKNGIDPPSNRDPNAGGH